MLFDCAADANVAFTPTDGQLGTLNIFTSDSTWEFQLRGCGEAQVALYADTLKENLCYTVWLGRENNTHVEIHDSRGVKLTSALYADHLSCDKLRKFWISWDQSVVKVGEGTAPHHLIAEYSNPGGPVINTLSVASAESNSKAEWEFVRRSGLSDIFYSHIIL